MSLHLPASKWFGKSCRLNRLKQTEHLSEQHNFPTCCPLLWIKCRAKTTEATGWDNTAHKETNHPQSFGMFCLGPTHPASRHWEELFPTVHTLPLTSRAAEWVGYCALRKKEKRRQQCFCSSHTSEEAWRPVKREHTSTDGSDIKLPDCTHGSAWRENRRRFTRAEPRYRVNQLTYTENTSTRHWGANSGFFFKLVHSSKFSTDARKRSKTPESQLEMMHEARGAFLQLVSNWRLMIIFI